MIEKFLTNSNYKLLFDAIENGENCSVFGLNIGEKLALIEDSAFIFYIVDSLDGVSQVYDKLTSLGRSCEILTNNITPLTSEFISTENTLNVLSKLKNKTIDSLIITPEVVAGKFPNKNTIQTSIFSIGNEINLTEFSKLLISYNYKSWRKF